MASKQPLKVGCVPDPSLSGLARFAEKVKIPMNINEEAASSKNFSQILDWALPPSVWGKFLKNFSVAVNPCPQAKNEKN